MIKKLLLALLFLFLLGAVFSYETPLSDFGFGGFENTTKNTTICKEVTVTLPQSALSEVGAGILSINANITKGAKDGTYVSVSINGGEEKKFWEESFACAQQCWARLFVPELKQNPVKLNICAVLGGASEKIEITKNSFIGLYNTPVLTIKNVAPEVIYLGERAKMSIIVSNTGTKSANIFVQFIHPDVRTNVSITSFDIVEGESSASTIIAPSETKQFVYYIKPAKISSYNLPLAALFFKNIFGEDETLLSNHPFMTVVEKKQINVFLVLVSEQEPKTFKAIIKNNFDQPFNGTITMAPQTEFEKYAQELSISANSEKEVIFQAKALDAKKYAFQATIMGENQIYSSNIINAEVTQSTISIQVLLAIAGIIVGAIIFGWIYIQKEK